MLEAVIGAVVGAASVGVSVLLGRGQARQAKQRLSVDRFLRVRNWLKDHEELLYPVAVREFYDFPDRARDGLDPSGLYQPGWVPEEPASLDYVQFKLTPEPNDPPGHLDVLRQYWPLDGTGKPLDRYHEAVTMYDAPGNWFNGTSYRALSVDASSGNRLEISVTAMKYWDGFDSSIALAFEAAQKYRSTGGKKITGPYRRRVGNPFALAGRYCSIGFGVLTLRRAPAGSTFFLHRRNEDVAFGANITGHVPAGEFQPSDDSRYSLEGDLDLWRAIMREYAEEFLGIEEVRLRTGAPIDYERENPFRELQIARRRGSIRLFLLGMQLDPVSWHIYFRIACVINSRTFDRIFSRMVSRNSEGLFELPSLRRGTTGPFQGWPLNEETVARYSTDASVSNKVRWSIEQVWNHRQALGL